MTCLSLPRRAPTSVSDGLTLPAHIDRPVARRARQGSVDWPGPPATDGRTAATPGRAETFPPALSRLKRHPYGARRRRTSRTIRPVPTCPARPTPQSFRRRTHRDRRLRSPVPQSRCRQPHPSRRNKPELRLPGRRFAVGTGRDGDFCGRVCVSPGAIPPVSPRTSCSDAARLRREQDGAKYEKSTILTLDLNDLLSAKSYFIGVFRSP